MLAQPKSKGNASWDSLEPTQEMAPLWHFLRVISPFSEIRLNAGMGRAQEYTGRFLLTRQPWPYPAGVCTAQSLPPVDTVCMRLTDP